MKDGYCPKCGLNYDDAISEVKATEMLNDLFKWWQNHSGEHRNPSCGFKNKRLQDIYNILAAKEYK